MKVRTTSFAHGSLERTEQTVPTIINNDMLRARMCAHCKNSYREFENVGAWKCRIHAMPWDHDRQFYPCCETNSKGCYACDHYENELVPYPGCVADEERWQHLVRGVPAFRLLEGNLKELRDVNECAIQRIPEPGATESRRCAATIYIYRRCPLGQPGDDD